MADSSSGLQIDLDAGEGLITKGEIYDFIKNPCTRLTIEFNCSKILIFHPNDENYFRYLTLEWVPLTCKFGHTSEGTWWYQIEAIPKQMFKFIDKPAGLLKIPEADVDLRQPVKDRLARLSALVGILQDQFAVLIALIVLIDLRDHAQRLHAADMPPVHRIRRRGCPLIIPGAGKAFYFLQPFLVFYFIHNIHLLSDCLFHLPIQSSPSVTYS